MEKIQAKVNYVLDGDTISVTDFKGNTFISRARWIDSPETKKSTQSSSDPLVVSHWQWGDRSKQFISQILIPGSTIILYNYGLDQYSRNLSDWYLFSISLKNNLQYQLISQGLACPFLPFDRYSFPVNRELVLFKGIIDGVAKANKLDLGFWLDNKAGKFILPHDFKKAMAALLTSSTG